MECQPHQVKPSKLRASLMASSWRGSRICDRNVLIFLKANFSCQGAPIHSSQPQPQDERDGGHAADAGKPQRREPQQALGKRSGRLLERHQ